MLDDPVVERAAIRANPVPLGLSCFAISVFMLAGSLWGVLPAGPLAMTALFVGGGGMLVAAVASYRRGDTFRTTWLGAYSAFWAALAFYLWFFAPASSSVGRDLAWIAFAWGIFTAYTFVGSLRVKAMKESVLLGLFFLTFLFMWLADGFGVRWLTDVAACAGWLTAIVAAFEAFVITWQTPEAVRAVTQMAPEPRYHGGAQPV